MVIRNDGRPWTGGISGQNELPGLPEKRPSTSDEVGRRQNRHRQSPKSLSGSERLPDVGGAWAESSRTSSIGQQSFSSSNQTILAPPRGNSRCSSKLSCAGSMWAGSCARRGCLCDVPPPLFRSDAIDKSYLLTTRSTLPANTGPTAADVDGLSFLGDDQDASTISQESGMQPSVRSRPAARASLAHIGNHPSLAGKSLEDVGAKTDGWTDADKPRKSFTVHLKTAVGDRLGKIDAQRRRTRRKEKQLEMKQKRFNALPLKEQDHISDAFEKFDVDASGELDRDEVVQCLKEFGLSGMTGEETRAIIDICSDASSDVADYFSKLCRKSEDSKDQVVQVVSVELHDFALTVIPRVRRKLQEMRSQALLRHFRMFDCEQKGFISMDACMQLCKELGIETSIFDECFQAEENSDEEDEDHEVRPPPTTIYFEVFQSVVFAAREKATRENRQKERVIQQCCSLPEETFQEFREDLLVLYNLFQRFDGDESGCLDSAEVAFMLKDFGLLPTDEKERMMVFDIMDDCDKDGSGEFEFNEFLGLVHQIRDFAMERYEEELHCTFERYDRDKSGELSVAELSILLVTLSLVPRTRREQEGLAHLIHLVDVDGSGKIDFREFQVLCQRIKEHMCRLRYDQERAEAMAKGFSSQETHDLRCIFDRLDTSLNGSIDRQEAKAGVQLTRLPVTVDVFEEAFRVIDTDSSGDLSFVEFTELMRSLKDREGMFQERDSICWSGSKSGPR